MEIERLGLVFELNDTDYTIEHMKNNDCPTLDMIDSIYLNGEQFYEWKMREWSCWSYEEIRLTKEEKLSELVHAIKTIHTIRARSFFSVNNPNPVILDELDNKWEKLLYELAIQLSVEYVCVNEGVDDLYYEDTEWLQNRYQ